MIRPQVMPTRTDAVALKLLTENRHPFQRNYSNQKVNNLFSFENPSPRENLMTSISLADEVYLTMDKTMSGEWTDTVLVRQWLKRTISRAVFNLLSAKSLLTNTPQGLSQIQLTVEDVLNAAIKLGGIQPTYRVWFELGKDRKATVYFKARLSGAIHNADVNGTLNF